MQQVASGCRAIALGLCAIALFACTGVTQPPVSTRETVVPLRSVMYRQALQPGTLLVLLPGKESDPVDFDRHDWISRLQASTPDLDIVAVDSHYGYYQDRSITRRLHEDVILPAQQAGYTRIWLMGTSLGGLGSVLYWREHPDAIEGVILFAPYLGPSAQAKRIQDEGWQHWQPEAGDDFDFLWQWLYQMPDKQRQHMWLLHGRFDPFWRQHRVLGALLPATHVHVIAGGHEWWTGSRLLDALLEQPPWLGSQSDKP